MVVVGATTAALATATYMPPFKYVTSNAPAVSVTGTITKPISNNPTVAPDTSDSDYAWAYLQSHMMSWPSYRYIYLFWIIIALLAGVYILGHHLRFRCSRLGAAISRWTVRRRPWGRKRPSTTDNGSGGRPRALPSNGVLLSILLLGVITILVSLIGADYISPLSSVLNFGTSFRKRQSSSTSGAGSLLLPNQISYSSPGYTISKSTWTLASRFGDTSFALFPLIILLALKSPPFALFSWRAFAQLHADKLAVLHKAAGWLVWITTTVHVVLWTVQLFVDSRNRRATWFAMWTNYRFICGVVAYVGLTGLMVASLRVVRKRSYEFFYTSHVILVLITLATCALHHPVLWFWIAAALGIWGLERLWRVGRMWRINGFSSPSSLSSTSTLTSMTLSAQSKGNGGRYADLPQQDHDIYAMSPLNSASRPRAGAAAEEYDDSFLPPPIPRKDGGYTYNGGDWTPESSPGSSTAELPGTYGNVDTYDRRASTPVGTGKEVGRGYVDDAFKPLGQGRYSDLSLARVDGRQSYADSGYTDPYATPRGPTLNEKRASNNVLSEIGQSIPKGYALAQLLPSRTIRLTIRVARPFKYSAGQSVLLHLPELSHFQSHPFSILNAPSGAAAQSGEVVLLVKARKGLTKALYELVKSRSASAMGAGGTTRSGGGMGNPYDSNTTAARSSKGLQGQTTVDAAPVYVRAKVDGPFGSAARVRWGEYASVVLVCGGSGVSFGMGVLEQVAGMIGENRGKVRRVRLIWIAREYAEIAWIAYTLRRLTSILSPSALQVDIFITNAQPRGSPLNSKRPLFAGESGGANRDSRYDPDSYDSVIQPSSRGSHPYPSEGYDDLAPPRAAFAGGAGRSARRSSSADSIASMASGTSGTSDMSMSVDGDAGGYGNDDGSKNRGGGYSEAELEAHLGEGYSNADMIDLTNFEDEDDVADPAEEELSSRLKGEGKVRRAKSRRVAGMARREKGGVGVAGPGRKRVVSGLATSESVNQMHPGHGRDDDSAPRSKSMLGLSEGQILAPLPMDGRRVSAASRAPTIMPVPRPQSGGSQSYESAHVGPFEDPLRPNTPGSARVPRITSHSSPHGAGSVPTSASKNLLSPEWSDGRDKRASYRSNLSGISGMSTSTSGYGAYPHGLESGLDNPVGLYRTNSPGSSMYMDDAASMNDADSTRGFAGAGQGRASPFGNGNGNGNGPGARYPGASMGRHSRTGSMVLLDEAGAHGVKNATLGAHGAHGAHGLVTAAPGLWVDMADYESMAVMAEYARTGRPALSKVVGEEVERAEGGIIIATCGPVTLNAVVRNVVSKHIGRGRRGQVALYSEDYD